MTKDQAISIVEQACKGYLGRLGNKFNFEDVANVVAAINKLKSLTEIEIQGTPPGAVTPEESKPKTKK